MKKTGKIISIFLALAVVAGVVYLFVSNSLKEKTQSGDELAGEKCGDEAYWTFDGSKLFIGGKGKMYEYDPTGELMEITEEGENCVPWRSLRNKVESIEIGNGITNIANWAFEGFTSLVSVDISGTVESIGRDAFESCSSLSDVKLNNGLKEIGPWAFVYCTSLEKIEFPDSLKIIDRNAFGECGLKEITIPATLEVLERDVFEGCVNLENVVFPKGFTAVSRGTFAGCTKLKKIDLPETLEGIGRAAFDGCSGLSEINIPDSVTEIGMGAFEGCTELNSIKMSKNITYIDEAAFENTGYYNNESNWEKGVLYIDEYLIGADNISGDYYIKSGTKSVARGAFDGCNNLTSITVPESVQSFAYNPLGECGNLKKVVFLGKEVEFDDVFSTNESELTFCCYTDSTAYSYAQEKGIKCVLMDGQ